MGLLPGYKKCFFCGPATGGLALQLQYDGTAAFTEFTVPDRFNGFDGVIHAGIVTGIIDEAMWWTVFMETRVICATWKLETEFRRPVVSGKTYRASGQFLGPDRHSYSLAGRIEDHEGKICALATARFRKMKAFTMDDLAKYLDFRGVPPEIRAFFTNDER
jgi:uncharacterized protein (TIGR00369 family)